MKSISENLSKLLTILLARESLRNTIASLNRTIGYLHLINLLNDPLITQFYILLCAKKCNFLVDSKKLSAREYHDVMFKIIIFLSNESLILPNDLKIRLLKDLLSNAVRVKLRRNQLPPQFYKDINYDEKSYELVMQKLFSQEQMVLLKSYGLK